MKPFTIDYYKILLQSFLDNGYEFIFFDEIDKIKNAESKIVLLRHDIDFDPSKALELSSIENHFGINSTYFFMLNSNFYNIHNIKTLDTINELINNGHRIGVHFDEASYKESVKSKSLSKFIIKEINFFEELLKTKTKIISFHRPASNILLNEINIPIKHTYEEFYTKDIKYLSDSRKEMPEGDFIEMINGSSFNKIQLLIHPIWWNKKYCSPEKDYMRFIKKKNIEIRLEISDNSNIYDYN